VAGGQWPVEEEERVAIPQGENDSQRPVKSYHDLVAWRKAISLAKRIYQITGGFPPQEIYGLTSQLRRAAVSIPSNIAEGQSRGHTREFIHFLYISLGSLAEVDTQLILARELGFLQDEDTRQLGLDLQELRRLLYGLVRSLPDR
jgi:four helix bundle protein